MAQEYKIYVGNLDYGTTEEEIKELFTDKGIETKTVTLILDKFTGKSKGFGFVEVDSDETIQKAVEILHGFELGGRKLTVNKAKPPRERGERRFSGGGRDFGSGRGGGRSRF
ncbi:RNA-binding protein [bacterium]|jgi:RNA recognition motif-containing protein|nr:RNA-binding protein [bacterium]